MTDNDTDQITSGERMARTVSAIVGAIIVLGAVRLLGHMMGEEAHWSFGYLLFRYAIWGVALVLGVTLLAGGIYGFRAVDCKHGELCVCEEDPVSP